MKDKKEKEKAFKRMCSQVFRFPINMKSHSIRFYFYISLNQLL